MRYFVLIVAFFVSSTAIATPGWVNDEAIVPMRSGAGSNYRIIRSALKSGTSIEVLKVGKDWTKVRYKGQVGFMRSQYVTKKPTAALRLEQLQQRYDRLANERKSELTLQKQLDSARSKLKKTSTELDQLKKVAANPVKINRMNRQLNEKVSLLQTELDQANAQNNLLKNDHTYRGWMYGLGTIFLGIIIGIWFKSRDRRSRSEWA